MAKKMRKDKELAHLRAQIEALKVQSQVESPASKPSKVDTPVVQNEDKKVNQAVSSNRVETDVSKDLRKTALITFLCSGILAALYISEPQWPAILNAVQSITNIKFG